MYIARLPDNYSCHKDHFDSDGSGRHMIETEICSLHLMLIYSVGNLLLLVRSLIHRKASSTRLFEYGALWLGTRQDDQ